MTTELPLTRRCQQCLWQIAIENYLQNVQHTDSRVDGGKNLYEGWSHGQIPKGMGMSYAAKVHTGYSLQLYASVL